MEANARGPERHDPELDRDAPTRNPSRRALLKKAAWTVPVVVSLGALDFGTARGAVTSPVGAGGSLNSPGGLDDCWTGGRHGWEKRSDQGREHGGSGPGCGD